MPAWILSIIQLKKAYGKRGREVLVYQGDVEALSSSFQPYGDLMGRRGRINLLNVAIVFGGEDGEGNEAEWNNGNF